MSHKQKHSSSNYERIEAVATGDGIISSGMEESVSSRRKAFLQRFISSAYLKTKVSIAECLHQDDASRLYDFLFFLVATLHFIGTISLAPSRSTADLEARVSMGIGLATVLFASVAASIFWLGSALLKKRKSRDRIWKPTWLVYILRSCLVVLPGVMFQPLVFTMLSPWNCVGQTATSWAFGLKCWGPAHSTLTALFSILLVTLLVFCCTVEVLNVRVHADTLRARVQGRAHAFVLLIRCGMAATLTIGKALSVWFIVFCLVCGFAAESFIWISYVPCRLLYRNCLTFAISVCGLWAVLALVVEQMDDTFGAINAGYFILFSLPLVAAGAYLAFWETFSARAAVSKNVMKSPYSLELHVRAVVFAAQNFVQTGIDEAARASIRSTFDSDETSPGKVQLGVSSPLTPTLRFAEHSLATGMKFFPQSNYLHLISADFVRTWRVNEHIEASHLESARRSSPALDEAFLSEYRSNELEKIALQRDAKHLRIQERVQYEENKADATANELASRGHLSSFWAILASRNPAISRLVGLSREIENSVDDTEEAYLAMLDINRRNVGVLRSYAQFVGDVLNDPTLCATVLAEADNAEDELSQEHTRKEANFSFMATVPSLDSASENLAVVSISDKSKSLGHITEVNAATLGAFGYSRSDLMGKNISSLLPEPLASRHDSFIQAYLNTGKAQVMGTVRMAFGLHSTGFIFPLLLSVRSLKTGFGGLMQPMNTQHNFILFTTRSGLVTAGCKSSLSMLGQSAVDMKDGKVNLNKFMHKWKVFLQICSEMNAAGDDVAAGEGDGGFVQVGEKNGFTAEKLLGGFYTTLKRTSASYCPTGLDISLLPHIVKSRGKHGSTCKVWAKAQITRMDASAMPGAVPGDKLGVLTWEPGLPAAESRAILDSATAAVRTPTTTVRFDKHPAPSLLPFNPESNNSFDADDDIDSLSGLLDEPNVHVEADSKLGFAPHNTIAAVSPMKMVHTEISDPAGGVGNTPAEVKLLANHSQLLSNNPATTNTSLASMKDLLAADSSVGHIQPDKSGDEDRASSVGSSDSQAALSSMLRSTVVERNKHPEESVLALQRSLMWVLALTGLFIAASAIMLSVLLGNYTGSLDLLHEAANRQVLGEEIMLIVQDQQVLAYQIQLFPAGSPLTAQAVQDFSSGSQALLTLIDDFESKNNQVFSNLANDAATGQNSLHVGTPLEMVVEEDGERVVYSRNLNDATFEFMGHVRVVVSYSPAQVFSDGDGHIRWLVTNAITNVMPGLNRSTVLFDDTFQNMASEADGLQFGLMVASVSLLGIVAAAIVVPTTCMAMRARDRIWQLLFNLPVRVVSFLQSRSSAQLAALSSDGAEAGDGFEEDTDDFSALSRVQYRTTGSRKEKRKLSNSIVEIFRTIVVFLFPLLLACGYYSGTYIWGNNVTMDIAESAHTLMWSYQRETLSLALLGTLMRATVEQNSTLAEIEIGGALTAASSLIWSQHALLYGTDGVQASSVDEERISIMMTDGCSAGKTYSVACDRILGGVLKTGAHAGVTEFVRFARLLLLERRESIKRKTEKNLADRLSAAALNALRLFGMQHLRDALRDGSTAVSSHTSRTINSYQEIHTFLTIGVGFMLLFGYLLIQIPIMIRLDGDVKRSRATLLYIPPAAVEQVPAVRQLLIHAGVLTQNQMKAVMRRGW